MGSIRVPDFPPPDINPSAWMLKQQFRGHRLSSVHHLKWQEPGKALQRCCQQGVQEILAFVDGTAQLELCGDTLGPHKTANNLYLLDRHCGSSRDHSGFLSSSDPRESDENLSQLFAPRLGQFLGTSLPAPGPPPLALPGHPPSLHGGRRGAGTSQPCPHPSSQGPKGDWLPSITLILINPRL